MMRKFAPKQNQSQQMPSLQFARPSATAIHEVLHSHGQPLDSATRVFMESRFGHDFSQVRVHTDARAAESAQGVGALAYTVGRDMVFGSGQYAPRTITGSRLLAHELTHTLQQDCNPGAETHLKIGQANEPAEREAETQAARVVGERPSDAMLFQHQGPPAIPRMPQSNRVADTAKTLHRAVPGSVGVQLQRQPQPPGTANAAQLYQQALGKLKALDPKLYGYLSKVPLGGGPKEILREVSQGQPGVPSLSVVINLDVALTQLPPNKDAEFSPGNMTKPTTPGAPFVFQFNMAINQSMPASTIPESLAEILIHEGTHLQIAMDKVVFDPVSKSPHATGFAKYQTTAKSLASYENLLIFLNNYMEMVLTKHHLSTDEEKRQKDAQKIMDLLLEEKYVYDQDKAKFGVSRTNAQLAVDYIKDGLNAVGIPPSSNLPNLRGVLVDVEDFLNELDIRLKPANTSTNPTQTPSGTP